MGKSTRAYIFRNLVVLLTLASCSVYAENNDSAKNALAKAQYMLRQASAEKAELAKEVAQQKEQVAALAKENTQLKLDLKNIKSATNPQDEVVKSLKEGGLKIQSKFQDQLEKNAILSDRNLQLEKSLSTQATNFDICYNNNKKLYQVNKEILGQYESKGFWDALKQKEPFTSIERVKVENLVQDYQYQIEALSVKVINDDIQEKVTP